MSRTAQFVVGGLLWFGVAMGAMGMLRGGQTEALLLAIPVVLLTALLVRFRAIRRADHQTTSAPPARSGQGPQRAALG